MEVVGLVGPAGTGKSYRASFVAHAYRLSHIVDDGLLIREGHIVAGVSAKREPTAMAAVRRALFTDPDHRAQVRAALARDRPTGVLVLGTSVEMVHRIVDALDLPRPERIVSIEDIASPDEVRVARRSRRVEGKHVIPAPTVEVRPSLSGIVVDPLRLLLRDARGRAAPALVEKSVVRPTFSALGRFFIDDTVVAAMVERAVREVPGVLGAGRARVSSEEQGVRAEVEVTLARGGHLPSVLRAAQLHAKAVVE
jgi:adenylate kinase family enzyme